MSLYTSKASGNWNATGQTTWNEVGTPVNGDTVSIAAAHTVTADPGATIIIGTSGVTGTAAITITGKLIIGAGATFIARGDVILNAPTSTSGTPGSYQLDMLAGSIFEFDASLAASPSTTNYVIGPARSLAPDTKVRITGSAGSRCKFRSNAGGGNGYFSNRGFNSRVGLLIANFCDFLRIGTAATPAFVPSFNANSLTGDIDAFRLTDCTLDFCGSELQATAILDGVNVAYTRVIRTNSLSANCCLITATSTLTSGTRAYTDCFFDVMVGNGSATMAGFTFTRCVLFGSWLITAHSTNKYAFVDCLIRKSVAGAGGGAVRNTTIAGGDLTRCIYFCDNTDTDNQKWLQNPTGYDVTINGGHVETTHLSDTTGELMSVVNAPGSLRNITMERITIAYNPNGLNNERSEALVTVTTTSANVGLNFNNNTWIAANEAVVALGEGNSGAAGTLKSYKSNIAYGTLSPLGSFQYHIHDYDANSANRQMAASAADVNYNCGFGLRTPSGRPVGYNSNLPAGIGANDVNVNPNFVDPTRNLAKWAASRGSAETHTAAMDILRADPSLVPTAYAWVQGGWAPTNTALKGTSHTGGDIGAVPVLSGGFNTFGNVFAHRSVSTFIF